MKIFKESLVGFFVSLFNKAYLTNSGTACIRITLITIEGLHDTIADSEKRCN